MQIINEQTKVFIEVVHKNEQDYKENLLRLKSDGWSENIDKSNRYMLTNDSLIDFKQKYPDVEVQMPKDGSFSYFTTQPYVFFTRHEKMVDENKEKSL